MIKIYQFVLLALPLTCLAGATGSENYRQQSASGLLQVNGHRGTQIERRYFRYSFDHTHTQAAWVSYQLEFDPDRFVYERTDDYREDPMLGKSSPRNEEFEGTGLDRGHLAPAQDFAFGARAISESFYLSNMSPQRPDFNQKGIWRILEDMVRNWSLYNQSRLYVVSGPVLADTQAKISKGSRIGLPRKFYKVILCQDESGQWHAIGFVLPHLNYLRNVKAYAVPVDKVERLTGLNFFSGLAKNQQDAAEATFNAGFWQL